MHKSTARVILQTLNAALGEFYFGYSLGVMNFTQETLNLVLKIDPGFCSTYQGIVGAAVPIGAFVGTYYSAHLLQKYSRRQTLMICDVLGSLSLILSVFILDPYLFVFFRFLSGLATGINSCVVPIYVYENSPLEINGLTGCISSSLISFGELVTYIFGLGFAQTVDINSKFWIFVIVFPAFTCFLRFIMFLCVYVYDSSAYYVKHHQLEDAKNSLGQIYQSEHIEGLLQEQIQANKESEASDEEHLSYLDLLKEPYRERTMVGNVLQILYQFTGINAVVFYSSIIFLNATNGNFEKTVLLSILFGSLNTFLNVISGVFTNKFGRKSILLLGTFACFLFLTLLSYASHLHDSQTVKNAFLENFIVILILGFTSGFEISLSPLVWTYNAEILPDKGVTLATLTNWAGLILIAFAFPIMSDRMGMWVSFLIFAICCLGGLLFIQKRVLETKGLNKEEIARLFAKKHSEEEKLLELNLISQD